MMNKKGITEDLPRLIAIVAGILVFVIVLGPPMYSLIKRGGETGKCDWNLLLAAGFKTATLGFGEIPVGCQAEYTTADTDTLEKTARTAKKRINKYCGESPKVGAAIFAGRAPSQASLFYAEAAKEFCETGQPTRADIEEWALDSMFGKRMVECWNKVWHGKLDFFSQEWSSRSFCVVCSVVRFSDDLPAHLKRRRVTSLYDWMNAERYYKTTYYEFVADGQTVKPPKEMLYYGTDEPYAITFMHTKGGYWDSVIGGVLIGGEYGAKGGSWGGPIGAGIGAGVGAILGGFIGKATDDEENVKQIFIIPYDLTRGICTDIIA
jgi:hypothetical protein